MESVKQSGVAAAKGLAVGEPGGSVSGLESRNKARVYDLNEEGVDDDGVVVVNRSVIVTETTVEMTYVGSERNGSEKVVQEDNTSSVLAKKSEFNGNGMAHVVDVDGSLDGANGNDAQRPSGVRVGKGIYAENGGDLVEDLKNIHPRSTLGLEGGDEDKIGGDKEQDFMVGDFVWGKIRSHPWWPGQVYDPSDASEFASKFKHEDRLLVAYFGDGSCAWCFPSQLVAFAEHFEEMSKHSASKSLDNAIKKALDEIGRRAELKMICSCVPEENRADLTRPHAVNAGVKPGVLVPEGDIGRIAIPEYKPGEVLKYVRRLGQAGSVANMLELVFMKSWLSAYYRVRSGCRLPTYHEPQEIEGLEEKSENMVSDTNEISVPIEVPIEGSTEEDEPSSLKSGPVKGPMNSDENLSKSRKQKSVAELMREDTVVKPKSRRKSKSGEGTPSTSIKKKRKTENEDVAESTNSQASTTRRKRGRKKKSEVSVSLGTASNERIQLHEKVDGEAENGALIDKTNLQSSTTGRKRGRKKAEICVSPDNAANEGIEPREARKRGRKKMKEISVAPGTLSNEADQQFEEKDDESLLSDKHNKKEDSGGDAKEESEKSLMSRERKKSKYLSPPYTTHSWKGGKSMTRGAVDTESEKISKFAKVGERMSKASSKLIVSPPISKCTNKTSETNMAKEHSSEKGKTVAGPKTAKEKEKMILEPEGVSASVTEVLGEVLSAGVNLMSLGNDSVELIKGFVTAFRSSTYSDGSNYKSYKKQKASRKRKLSNVMNLGDTPSPQPQTRSAKIETPRSRVTKLKKDVRAAATDKREVDNKASPVSLIVSFSPDASLPSKDEIIEIFSSYGSVNEAETEVRLDSHCAEVAFTSISDAEKAFKESIKQSPFGASGATYRLRYSSAAARTLDSGNGFSTTPKKRGSRNPVALAPTDERNSQVGSVKQKLGTVRAMLERCSGKISAEEKSSLESEMRSLLQKASALAVKTSS